ncbi:MAG: alpha/beta fold hydrolase [Acidimicrobiia bacterium]
MRMVFVPGFTQTAASWSSVLAQLPLRAETVVAEIPSAPTFDATVDALVNEYGAGCWIGYSMGGRLALRAALRHPEAVRALVLVSATAGMADPDDRAARVRADAARADEVESIGTEAFLEAWLAQPMFASLPANAPGLADRRTLSPDALAHQLRVLGTGVMPSCWDALGALDIPVLVVTGTHDEKFDTIGTELATGVAHATHVRIDAGHCVPLEAPEALARAIETFLHYARS